MIVSGRSIGPPPADQRATGPSFGVDDYVVDLAKSPIRMRVSVRRFVRVVLAVALLVVVLGATVVLWPVRNEGVCGWGRGTDVRSPACGDHLPAAFR